MEDLLSRVERPSRYLGNEVHAVKKDLSTVSVKVALAYPDLYEIGMSNTGLHILYHMLNEDPEVAAERVYLPARDLEALLRAEGRPLATLENRVPLGELDILGIQIPHELAFANIVKMIRLARIPLWSAGRRDHDPIVLGGGPGVFAAEPVAPFYDAMLLGDAEEALFEVVAAVRDARRQGAPRQALLERLAAITGVYVPSFYAVRHHKDGRVAAIEPRPGAPPLVLKALVEDLETAYYPDKAIVPYADTVHDRLPIEVMRGCTVGCRFCQAGMIYRPVRERSPRRILDLAKCGLGSTGFEDISLLSLDTGDYTLIDPLTRDLLEVTADKRVALSLPSLRAGSLTDDVIRDVTRVRRTSFTIAPEAGTQRLRDVINKNISDEEVLETVERVARNGWTGIKMYFMVGFPTETQQDLDGLVDLVTRCRDLGQRFVRRFECTASIGTLVPKPHTPFQWDAQLSMDEAAARLKYVARALRARKVSCKYHDPLHSWVEGIFSRGDRRLAPVIAAAEARGAGFESWSDQLQPDLWLDVLAEHGLEPEWYLRRREHDEVLPWDHLSARVTKKYLLNDRLKVDRMAAPTTFDCRDDLCSGCSVCFTDDIRNRLAKYQKDPFADGRRLPIALTSPAVVNPAVARQLEQQGRVRDQAAKSGSDALEAKRRRRRPRQPGERRWHVTPGAPGADGPAEVFLEIDRGQEQPAPDALPPREAAAAPAPAAPVSAPGRPEPPSEQGPAVHYRVVYERKGDLRWLSHREVMRAFYHVAQRLELPVRYTEGYHPKPKLAFGPPLPVGAESLHEELDLFLNAELPPEQVLAELRRVMPPGLAAREVARGSGKSAHSQRVGARWSATLPGLDAAAAVARWEDPAQAFVIQVERPGKRPREVHLRRIVGDVRARDGAVEFDLRQDDGSAKPWEVLATLTGLDLERARQARFRLVAPLHRAGAAVPAPLEEAADPA
ncbi:MAG: TIGR03960 family B12-binding radical SAM protein [Planctomycetes bacterium]|nr:TIGR03960 family B12-binding radical SAM protein [Planctomycetota bacterium]